MERSMRRILVLVLLALAVVGVLAFAWYLDQVMTF
jgi:hypothetical protein